MEAVVAVNGIGGLSEEDVPIGGEKRNRRGSGAASFGRGGRGNLIP